MAKTIKDLMTAKVVTVTKGTLVSKALEIMEQNNFRHLPVVDSNNKVIGILSDRDFVSVSDFESIKVDAAMTTTVYKVKENESIKKSVTMMVDKKISCLIVQDDKGKPVGIVTTDDILKAYAKTQD